MVILNLIKSGGQSRLRIAATFLKRDEQNHVSVGETQASQTEHCHLD